jgi:deoxyribodipyrimidine photolyase-related protein
MATLAAGEPIPWRISTMARWLFADQLGPWFLPEGDEPVVLIESMRTLRCRPWHRQKLHLILSALRHRAAELDRRAVHVRAASFREGLAKTGIDLREITVCEPTSRAADRFVRALGLGAVVPHPGFATHRDDFAAWATSRGDRRLLLEDFYRWQRRRHGVLLEPGGGPTGGRWNFDADNRERPPRGATALGLPPPFLPTEDEIDAEVREDLDRWTAEGRIRTVGKDGSRWWAATRTEALTALEAFVRDRLPSFGPHEDAMLGADPVMAHSLLSAPMNLGLLHPLEVVRAAEAAYRSGVAPIASVEGFVRQVLGWREYVWGLYWWFDEGYRRSNALGARGSVPAWLDSLDAAREVRAECLRVALRDVRDRGWTHHIPRLMVLGNHALQRGIDPAALSEWFQRSFVDGYDWVMLPNVVGMSQWADGGRMATKPYVSGGAYIDRMSDHCRRCPYEPTIRVGSAACPFTAGYWAFLDRHAERFRGNHRMARALAGLTRLHDLDALRAQEAERGTTPP